MPPVEDDSRWAVRYRPRRSGHVSNPSLVKWRALLKEAARDREGDEAVRRWMPLDPQKRGRKNKAADYTAPQVNKR